MLSPDGQYYWDGAAWRPASPDHHSFWDGTAWQAIPAEAEHASPSQVARAGTTAPAPAAASAILPGGIDLQSLLQSHLAGGSPQIVIEGPASLAGTDLAGLIAERIKQARAAGTGQPRVTSIDIATQISSVLPAHFSHLFDQITTSGGLASIRAHDPGFDETAFLAQAERCLAVVKDSVTRQDPQAARAVMSDAAWEKHRIGIEAQRRAGRRTVVESLSVTRASVVQAHTDPSWDTIAVDFQLRSAEYEVDAAGHHSRHDAKVRDRRERWTFQRSARAATEVAAAAPHRCPTCGAPYDVDACGICAFCHVRVADPTTWVVSLVGVPEGRD